MMNRTVQLGKPLDTLRVAAEMLGSNPRVLMLYSLNIEHIRA